MFYTLIKHGFFDQSESVQDAIYIINRVVNQSTI